jgi:hypothetical protein
MKVDIKDVYSRSLEIFREDLENKKLIDRYRKEKIVYCNLHSGDK